MEADMWDRFSEYMGRPFKGAAEMDALDWFLFLGLLLIMLAGWRIIFSHLEEVL